jgi:hypothetical protein
MFLLRLCHIAYKYLTMLQSPPGTGKQELAKKRRSHRQMDRQEQISKQEKVFPQTGRETSKTEFLQSKMHSHRQVENE